MTAIKLDLTGWNLVGVLFVIFLMHYNAWFSTTLLLIFWLVGFIILLCFVLAMKNVPDKFIAVATEMKLKMELNFILAFAILTLAAVYYHWWVSATLIAGIFYLVCKVIQGLDSLAHIANLQKMFVNR